MLRCLAAFAFPRLLTPLHTPSYPSPVHLADVRCAVRLGGRSWRFLDPRRNGGSLQPPSHACRAICSSRAFPSHSPPWTQAQEGQEEGVFHFCDRTGLISASSPVLSHPPLVTTPLASLHRSIATAFTPLPPPTSHALAAFPMCQSMAMERDKPSQGACFWCPPLHAIVCHPWRPPTDIGVEYERRRGNSVTPSCRSGIRYWGPIRSCSVHV